ncbi:lmo0937 family membrane protein [Cellulophaga sp. HaHaR_3_176]|uniref:lmo0937 family membrane protein n=1 Tax=Cellulophaga sp. HaHaR_3_176 TaxID=1942464 RepID=UPI001C1FACC8|nr:lmo0937 family membrane protein [Cellulophaga sp. HaHaR_3_176]QWX84636.1 lmo0937 family membrane protein [Cellulophaga sp. HaHaR_3_176]
MKKIIWGFVVVLILIWIVAFLVFKILSGLVHIILIAAIVLAIYNLFRSVKEKV